MVPFYSMAEQNKELKRQADLFADAMVHNLNSLPAAVTRLPLGQLKGKSPTTQNSPSNEGAKSEANSTSGGVRRVTGSADISLNADGKQQSKELAKTKATQPFDIVLSSPEKRAIQTAKEFGEPRVLSGLDAWKRGALEGKPVQQVKGQIKFLMLNPDKRPPGKSPISGEAGESLNECAYPFLATIQAIEAMVEPHQRILVVSHGGNLQIADAWGKAGKPEDLSFDHKKMAQVPYWSVTGRLFVMGEKGLEEVPNDEQAGRVYYTEHAETAYNPRGAQDKGKR